MTLSLAERLVVDSSVAVKWVVAEPGNERAITLRDHDLVAPDLLFAECANILWRKQRYREISPYEARAAARIVEQADIAVVSAKGYMARAVSIATELDHPAYDALYLAVAEGFGLRLATADYRLIRRTEQADARFRAMLLPLWDIPPTGYSA